MRFENQVVLVTGAGAGIGRAAALAFAKEGARVAVNSVDISAQPTMQQLREMGKECIFLQGNIALDADAQMMVRETVKAFGRLDVLINNAGIVLNGYLHNTTEEDFMKTMDVNVKGTFLMSKYAVIQMRSQGGGVIVNNASAAGLKGHTNRLAYASSKGAVIAMTKSAALEYCRENIRVNCICPGTTLTPSLKYRIETSENPEKTLQEFSERQPIGRLGNPDEIAQAMLFAADPAVSYMTGSVLMVDGGMTM